MDCQDVYPSIAWIGPLGVHLGPSADPSNKIERVPAVTFLKLERWTTAEARLDYQPIIKKIGVLGLSLYDHDAHLSSSTTE